MVVQRVTSIIVTPTASNLYDGQTAQYAAVAYDQFGAAFSAAPAFSWTVTGSGTISSTGLYTAPASGPATDSIKATINSISGTASANVTLSVINGTPGNDTIRLVRSGANLLVYLNGATALYNVSFGLLSDLTIACGAGLDTINIDFSGGATPVPSGGMFVNGSGGVTTLVITGTTSADLMDIYTNTLVLNGSTVSYSNLANITFNGDGGPDTLIQHSQPANGATVAFNALTSGGPSLADNLNVSGGSFVFPKPVTGGAFQPISISSLILGANAILTLGSASAPIDRSVVLLNSLSIASTSQLDLGSNDLILHNSSFTTANISQFVLTQAASEGFNGGGPVWQGNGILSSSASADTSHLMTLGVALNSTLTTFDSQPVSNTDVLIKYTYFGDVNFDGKVDGSDYSRIDNGFLLKLTGWYNGDLNYDNVINGSDYTLMDNAFNRQSTARPSAMLSSHARSSTMENSITSTTAATSFSTVPVDDTNYKKAIHSTWASLADQSPKGILH